MGPSHLDLLRLQLNALFVLDEAGRLRFVREPGYEEHELDSAPRFFLGRGREEFVWAVRGDVPDEVVHELAAALGRGGDDDEVRAILSAHVPISDESRGPAFLVPETAAAPGETVVIDEANLHVLDAHFPRRRSSRARLAFGPVVAALNGKDAVSMCFCSRLVSGAAEAGVETAREARGRGFASAAVATWARAVRSTGRLPLYSTSWDNLASRGVARRLGMMQYGEDWSIH